MTVGAMQLRRPATPSADRTIRLMEAAPGGRAGAAPVQPAALVRHILGPQLVAAEGWDARTVEAHGLRTGLTWIADLRTAPAHEAPRTMRAVDVLIPWAVFDDIAEALAAAPITGFETPPDVGLADDTIRHLIGAMRPGLRAAALPHYIQPLGLALASHVAHTYGGLRPGEVRSRGGLAPHVLKRAKAQLLADLRAPPSLETLAEACGLSPRHFARAFQESTGLTPHRWTMRARVAAAKVMMQADETRLAEIALTCGFADQSHLTRVFKRETGAAPAAWRRVRDRPAREAQPPHPTPHAPPVPVCL